MAYLLVLTLILTPTYIARFPLFNLPTNFLMVWLFLVWLIFGSWLIINKRVKDFIKFKLSLDKKILLPVCLFFLAGVFSLFIGGVDRAKLGQFIVLFVQPISLFFIAGYIFKQNPKAKSYLLLTTYYLLALAGLYAIIQYFTFWGLPSAWWGNTVEPKRALSFFVHPNFYALWSAPLLALLIPDLAYSLKSKIYNLKSLAWLLGAIGLLLSLSRAGWLGLAAAVVIYLIAAADNKIRAIFLAGIIIVLSVVVYFPGLRYRVLLPFYGEKSANSRIELWDDGLKAVKESPFLGLGLSGFSRQYGSINTDPTLDTHNFPHNIFLNFWLETGLLGLVSFLFLVGYYIFNGFKNRQGQIKLGVALFIIAMISQGLIDNPYFKNDLALVFWVVLSLS